LALGGRGDGAETDFGPAAGQKETAPSVHWRQHHNRERVVVDEWVAWLIGCLGGLNLLILGSVGRSNCCFLCVKRAREREGGGR
jgi:hypothetical protein